MERMVRTDGNEFITELSNAQVTMLIEALDYATRQARSSYIEVFGAFEDAESGADEAEKISNQLQLALRCADKGTVVITY